MMTDGDGEASRKKGDPRKVLRVMTNKEGLPKPRLMSDSGKSWTNQEANTVITMITGSPSE
ncbi:hypothetical protein M433DRAFT_158062 [Acidomyces richmondensis BFW]|nr:hypothetical protein M433DRAFT_158062 [Acidomyces richmondensis BFW]